jgi:hypothetical protein
MLAASNAKKFENFFGEPGGRMEAAEYAPLRGANSPYGDHSAAARAPGSFHAPTGGGGRQRFSRNVVPAQSR